MENNMTSEVNQENKLQNFSQKKFISDLYTGETTKYILENRISDIEAAQKAEAKKIKPIVIPEFESTEYYKQYADNKKDHKELYTCRYKECLPTRILGRFLDFLKLDVPRSKMGGCLYFFIWMPIYLVLIFDLCLLAIIPGLYDSSKNKQEKKKVEIQNEEIRKENVQIDAQNKEMYNVYYSQYEEFVEGIKKDYADYLAKRKKEIQAITESLEHEKQIAQAELKKTEEFLEALYNLRIDGVLCLHPNYKGLYPISIIYGYFDTGRCSCLTGHEGAYNLYEEELRFGLISRKLDNIVAGLQNLNSTTYYVAQAVEKCNAQIKNMNSSMYTMIECISDSNLENASYHDKMEKLSTSIAEENAEFYENVTRRMDSARLHYYQSHDAEIRR